MTKTKDCIYRVRELVMEESGAANVLEDERVVAVLASHRATQTKWYLTVLVEVL
jgi:hypothetical protein